MLDAGDCCQEVQSVEKYRMTLIRAGAVILFIPEGLGLHQFLVFSMI
jgi:hypothetical protein